MASKYDHPAYGGRHPKAVMMRAEEQRNAERSQAETTRERD